MAFPEPEQEERRRLTPRLMAGLAAAFVVGGILGAIGERLSSDTGPMRATETGALTQETVDAVPPGPVLVRSETLRLPENFLDTRTQEGPTFNIVESGQIEVTREGRAKLYGPGELFIERAGEESTVRAEETTILRVIQLLPASSGS